MIVGERLRVLREARGKDARYLRKICGCLSRMSQHDRQLLMGLVENMARAKSRS